MAERYRSEWLSSGMVKVFYDGVLDSWTAVMVERLCRPAGLARRAAVFAEQFAEVAIEVDRRGLQIAVHAIGDGAVRAVLDGYEAAQKQNGRRDSRHRIEHIEVTTEQDMPRFAELGVIASMQPPHPPGAMGLPLEPTVSRIGRARWPLSYAWRTLKDAGAHIVFASDWPVSPIDPIAGIQAAMLRKPWAEGMPDQSFSLHEALAGYTVEGAYAGFMEDRKGRLKPGYLADLVVLSGDLEAADPEQLHEVEAGHDHLRRQDHLSGLTPDARSDAKRVESWFSSRVAKPACHVLTSARESRPAARAGCKQWGVCVPERPDRNAIDVRGVSKIFGAGDGKVAALDNVSVSIRENEFFTLLGPSGCGKTTLLRLIAGFDYPTEGEILLYGEDIAPLPPFKRPVNTVFQNYALFPHMTVGENIGFGLRDARQAEGRDRRARRRDAEAGPDGGS